MDPIKGHLAARVLGVHRNRVDVAGEKGRVAIDLNSRSAEMGLAIGDWVLLDENAQQITKRLDPFGVFKRRAAGTGNDVQAIAANVDTVFIVTSANRDFNPARLERYLAIAHDASAFPLIVITKTDLQDSVDSYIADARQVSRDVLVEALDARDPEQVAVLRTWCGLGQTVAFLGSSGVGKSTLINTLAGTEQTTSAAREDDQRGRHTTTSRSMHLLRDGAWLIDTPGMRELQLVGVSDALDDVFKDIAEFARLCKFKDCDHGAEPGCAVQNAIMNDELVADRLERYQKLRAEDKRNSETVAESRSRDKTLGKLYKSIQSDMRTHKGRK
jgi:ribosome biogenesis GTPase